MDAKLIANQRFEIWIDITERIASMHEVQEYQHITFSSEEEWNQFIDKLIQATYRFQ